MGRWNLVGAEVNQRGRRGRAPALLTVNIPIRPPPCNEPGDPQWRGSTARVAVSSLSAAARRPCLSLWERCPVRTLGGEGLSVSQQPSQSASPPALPEGEPSGGCFSFVGVFWLGASVSGGFAVPHPSRLRRATFPPGEGFLSVHHPVTNRVTASGGGLLPG